MKNETQKANRKLTWQLWLFAAGFLAFGFALVSCEEALRRRRELQSVES